MISHKWKFIFVHMYKTGGTSIREALKPFCSNWRMRLGGKIAMTLGHPSFSNKIYQHHVSASELVQKIGEARFRSYFSFAFVRNPWDWQVSLYTYMLKEKSHYQHELAKSFSGFDEYIEWRCAEEVRLQRDYLFSKDGRQLVDFVGRFENLEEDFGKICARIGISAVLPKLNVTEHHPYQEFYTPRTENLVRRAFEADIKLFDYEFDRAANRQRMLSAF